MQSKKVGSLTAFHVRKELYKLIVSFLVDLAIAYKAKDPYKYKSFCNLEDNISVFTAKI